MRAGAVLWCLPYLYRGPEAHQAAGGLRGAISGGAGFSGALHARRPRIHHQPADGGEELPDPLGLEFRTLFNEQNLGAPIDTALENFDDRVPLLDVRFFMSAVLLQKQTGGNLSEILTRLAYVIRERFRLKGQVKAASAHGRVTARF